jgi:ABC-type nitrate/sulfonate/bicarbonate transport system substrate-binding protein
MRVVFTIRWLVIATPLCYSSGQKDKVSYSKLLDRIEALRIFAAAVFLLCAMGSPSEAAEKLRAAYTSPTPTQGVLWVADVGGLFDKNGLSVEIIYTWAAIEALVAGEIDFGQMTGSLMSSARLQGADPVMIAGVQDVLDDRLVGRPNI